MAFKIFNNHKKKDKSRKPLPDTKDVRYSDYLLNSSESINICAIVSTKGGIGETEVAQKVVKTFNHIEKTLIICGGVDDSISWISSFPDLKSLTYDSIENTSYLLKSIDDASKTHNIVHIFHRWSFNCKSVSTALSNCKFELFDNVILLQGASSAPYPQMVGATFEPICRNIFIPTPFRKCPYYMEPLANYNYYLKNQTLESQKYQYAIFDNKKNTVDEPIFLKNHKKVIRSKEYPQTHYYHSVFIPNLIQERLTSWIKIQQEGDEHA